MSSEKDILCLLKKSAMLLWEQESNMEQLNDLIHKSIIGYQTSKNMEDRIDASVELFGNVIVYIKARGGNLDDIMSYMDKMKTYDFLDDLYTKGGLVALSFHHFTLLPDEEIVYNLFRLIPSICNGQLLFGMKCVQNAINKSTSDK